METLTNDYINNLKSKNLSKNTLEAYQRDLKKFNEFLKESKSDFQNINVITIMAYVQKLQKDGKAHSSIVRNIICIKNFYKHCQKSGLIKDNPFLNYEIPKLKHEIPEVLTVDEVDKIMNVQDLNSNKGIRDKAMLELMYAAGLKVNELLNLTIFDINIKLSYLRCKGFKQKERIVPFGSFAANCLTKYLNIREDFNVNNYDYLFFNSKGNRMTRQGFWKIIKYYANIANINKNINLYTLRHSFAVHLLENGADIKSVQELLGNSSIYSIGQYGNISRKNKLAEVYKSSHPRA